MNTVEKMEKIWDGAGEALSGRSLETLRLEAKIVDRKTETVRLEAKVEELEDRFDKYVFYTEQTLDDLMDRIGQLEEDE